MSSIVFNTIDKTFPVPGVDNPSQGFRDNFTIIHDALATTYTEISSLEQNVMLKGDLITDQPVINNLNGSSIINGKFNDFYAKSLVASPLTTTVDIKPTNGLIQSLELATNTTIRFAEWPPAGLYAKLRIHLQSTNTELRNVSFLNNSGIVRKSSDFPTDFTVAHAIDAPKQKVVEAWSFDGGVTIYLRYLGEY